MIVWRNVSPLQVFQDKCCKREISGLEVYCTNSPACSSVVTLNHLQVISCLGWALMAKLWHHWCLSSCFLFKQWRIMGKNLSHLLTLCASFAGAPEVVSLWGVAVHQSRLQSDATEEVPAGAHDQNLSSPQGALPALSAAAAAQPHPGNVAQGLRNPEPLPPKCST